jgi:uncharacterized protein
MGTDLTGRAGAEPTWTRRWSGRDLAALGLVGLVAPAALSGLLRAVLPPSSGALPGLAGVPVAVVAVVWCAQRRGLPPAALGLLRPRGRWLLPAGAAGVGLVVVNAAVGLGLHALGLGRLAGTAQWPGGLGVQDRGAVLVLVATVVLGGPLVEELVFRGVLLRGLTDRFGVHVGLPVSAAAFLLAHGEGMGAFHLVAGFGYGWLAHRSGSLWPAILAHALNNAAVLGLHLLTS